MTAQPGSMAQTPSGLCAIAGALRDHPLASALANEVMRVHHRYAVEVVGAHRLCPFMNDPATAFGRFCVMLDRAMDVEAALSEVAAAGTSVVHLVYPLIDVDVTTFERFGNRLHMEVAKTLMRAPVHATFHPLMEGDATSATRLVGMLRRAPDPFVQFVPEGLHEGGTTYLDPQSFDPATYAQPRPTPSQHNHERLSLADVAAILECQEDIRDDRDRSYARFLDAMR